MQELALGPLFEPAEKVRFRDAMEQCIEDYVPRAALRDPLDKWWMDTKASDEFLDRLFDAFFRMLKLPNLISKTDYHVLARHVHRQSIDPEVGLVLDDIVTVAAEARPIKELDMG